ncbi:MAG: ATP-binding protein, partial [Vicinamibacterales bacterium]|nr:ATP-binding protein [Vicinamibacterales bacterium]
DFAKIEAGRIELECLDFAPKVILDQVSATVAVHAHGKGLRLVTTMAPNVPARLRGDPGRLTQILTNLVGNAVKFTHHGEVAVHLSVVGTDPGGTRVRFSVRDTGIGIPAAKFDRLFDRFSQVDASTTRRYGGTGLGLAISKRLVQQMGGEIGAVSEEGRGSEFWFTVRLAAPADDVPRGESPGPEEQTGPPPEAGSSRAARILLAEDDPTNRLVALGILKKLGQSATAVVDGAEALAAVERDQYDLVLMDVQMPVMDGFEATRQIRQVLPATRHLPIIAMTAHAMQGDRDRCLDAGMDDYVTKPVEPAALARVLRTWLPHDTSGASGGRQDPAPLPIRTST